MTEACIWAMKVQWGDERFSHIALDPNCISL